MIKAGIIGCGNIGWKWDTLKSRNFNTHAKAYYHNPGVNLRACCDTDFGKAMALAKNYAGVVPYKDYKTMLYEEELDMVSVCTNTETHFEILAYMLKHTDIRYIISEKPLTPEVKETDRIISLAKKKKAFIIVNYLRRWDTTLNNLRQYVLTKELGAFQLGRIIYYGGVKRNAVHLIDFLRSLGVHLVFKCFLSGIKKYKNDFAASILFETDRTKPVYFNLVGENNFPCLEMDLFYEKGRVRIGDYGDAEIFLAGDSATYPDFRELILKRHLPSTICRAMKNMIDYFVHQYQQQNISFDALKEESGLIRFISRIENLQQDKGYQ